ncbi:glutathione S-transferase [Nitrosomonas halophila]|uniref:Glutathione S-transferase n=1 Tax=Nitrosomonas halophila TaxID=44576 RepID=A0A1H3J017_9PROT|nr:glutathione S-transferase [Nitrosomonas halophila]SDY33301.1 glutathione S-transferase [Nitrosomonas halophila]
MELIGSLTSPYVRKVRIVLAEKNIPYQFTVDPPFGPDNQVAKVNPLGKVPALITDDGQVLFDSRLLAEYLDGMDAPALIPVSGWARWRAKRWEVLADGISDACAAIFLERKRPAAQQSPEWIERQQKKIELGLQVAAHELGEKPWCEGTSITLADIALGCALDYLSFRFPHDNWRELFPNLAGLADKLVQRQSFIQTAPKD